MSSVVTRRTVVRESTMSKRRTSNVERYSGEEKENPGLSSIYHRFSSSSQADLPAYKGEDYFESGSYRPDRLGKPWRSPNLSRRGIHSSYTECESMRKRQSKSSYTVSETSYGGSNSSGSQTHVVSSTTPTNSAHMRPPQHTGDTGGMCDHADSLSQTTERHLTTKVMHELWNTNQNNSMSHATKRQSSNGGRSSAVGRVSVWRASSDSHSGSTSVETTSSAGLDHASSSTKNGGRSRDSKKVSSIFGLDEANEGRITRSRSKRLDAANHVNSVNVVAKSDSNMSNSLTVANSTNNSNSQGITLYFWHARCVMLWISGLFTRLKRYSGAPLVLLIPFYLLAMLVIYILCLPYRLGCSILTVVGSDFKSTTTETATESRERRRRRSGWCWPCIFIIVPLLLLLTFLLCGSDSDRIREQGVSAIAFGKESLVEVGSTLKEVGYKVGSSVFYFLESATTVGITLLDYVFRGVIHFLAYVFYNIVNFMRSGTSSPLIIYNFMRDTVCTTKDYILMVIQSEAAGEMGRGAFQEKNEKTVVVPPPVVQTSSAPVSGAVSDEQFASLLAKIQEHDRRLREQEKDLQEQRKKLDQMLVSVLNSEKNTGDLRVVIANWDKDMKSVKSRAIEVDGILNQLKEFRKQLAKTDSSLILEMANKQKDTSGKELQALRTLVENLRDIVEKNGDAVKADLSRHEEALKLLSLKASQMTEKNREESSTEKKVVVAADPEYERLIAKITAQVTTGHQRIAALESHHKKLVVMLGAVKREQSKLAVLQQDCEKKLMAVSDNVNAKTEASYVKSLCASVVPSSSSSSSEGGVGDGSTGVIDARFGNVQQMIDRAIAIFAADRLGRPDFALESAGGSIIGTRCTQTYTDRPAVFSLFGVPLFRLSRSPRSVIQPAVQPGECWAFRGSKGQVVVRLSNDVAITAVTLEHIPTSLSPNGKIESAPRDIELYGLESESDYKGWLLGKFEYRADGPPLQTFDVVPVKSTDGGEKLKSKKARPTTFRYVEMKVLSNQGHPEYTCVYRLRVHGNFVEKAGNGST